MTHFEKKYEPQVNSKLTGILIPAIKATVVLCLGIMSITNSAHASEKGIGDELFDKFMEHNRRYNPLIPESAKKQPLPKPPTIQPPQKLPAKKE